LSTKTILVIGQGFLGNQIIIEALDLGLDVIGTHHSKINNQTLNLDVTSLENAETLVKKINPNYIINCAARGDVEFLQKHKEAAMTVNATGSLNVAKICRENDIRLIHISTDAVFDGKNGCYSEDDLPNPVNVYAQSKLEGEINVAKTLKDYVIVRTNFYGLDSRGKYFLNWILSSLKNSSKIIGFTDVIFSPLDTNTLSRLLIELLSSKYTGIIHLSSGQPISKYNFILEVAKNLSFSTENIVPGKLSDVSLIAPRPKNTSLKNQMQKKILSTPIIDLQDWLEQNKKQLMTYLD